MSQPPPRPAKRPQRTSSSENGPKGTSTAEAAEPRESQPDSRGSEDERAQPETLAPSSHGDKFRADEEHNLAAKLTALDTLGAAENPEAVAQFTKVAGQLESEGPGGPTAAKLNYPALGPSKELNQGSIAPPRPSTRPSSRPSARSHDPDRPLSHENNSEPNSSATKESDTSVSLLAKPSSNDVSGEASVHSEEEHGVPEAHGVSADATEADATDLADDSTEKVNATSNSKAASQSSSDSHARDDAAAKALLASEAVETAGSDKEMESGSTNLVGDRGSQKPGVSSSDAEREPAENDQIPRAESDSKEGSNKAGDVQPDKSAESRVETNNKELDDNVESSEPEPRLEENHSPSFSTSTKKDSEDDKKDTELVDPHDSSSPNDQLPDSATDSKITVEKQLHTFDDATEDKMLEVKEVNASPEVKHEMRPGSLERTESSKDPRSSSDIERSAQLEERVENLEKPENPDLVDASDDIDPLSETVKEKRSTTESISSEKSSRNSHAPDSHPPESHSPESLSSNKSSQVEGRSHESDESQNIKEDKYLSTSDHSAAENSNGSENSEDLKTQESRAPPPKPVKRPEKPLAPKPKSLLASRFEAAIRENEAPKPKPVLKPKPKMNNGKEGRIGALQAAMFADLNAALSKGPPPGGRPRFKSHASDDAEAEGASEKAGAQSEDGDKERSVDVNESAESQLSAMPKNPRARAAPSRRKRLPDSAKPKFNIVVPAAALWELPAEADNVQTEARVETQAGPSTAPQDQPSSEPSGEPTAVQAAEARKLSNVSAASDEDHPTEAGNRRLGVHTELDLRDALFKSLSHGGDPESETRESENFSARPDTEQNHPTSNLPEPSHSTRERNIPDIGSETNFATGSDSLSLSNLPSLGSLIDKEPSVAELVVDDVDHDPMSELLAEENKAPTVLTPSADVLGVGLSRYLDKSPQSASSTQNLAEMQRAESYFVPSRHDANTETETATQGDSGPADDEPHVGDSGGSIEANAGEERNSENLISSTVEAEKAHEKQGQN